jgi:hypothetical protein
MSPAVASSGSAAEKVAELQARIRGMQRTRVDSHGLPTAPEIASLLGGPLRAGSAYSVPDSVALATAMMAAPSAAGVWCAVVGMPSFGVAAAAGVDLERLVFVPDPGDQWLTVTAAVADVVGVVVAVPPARVAPAEVSRLGARLRGKGSTLIALGDWPQSEATLRVSGSEWVGLDAGSGHLQARRVTVTVNARAGAGRPRSASLFLPDADGRLRRAERVPAAWQTPAVVPPREQRPETHESHELHDPQVAPLRALVS